MREYKVIRIRRTEVIVRARDDQEALEKGESAMEYSGRTVDQYEVMEGTEDDDNG